MQKLVCFLSSAIVLAACSAPAEAKPSHEEARDALINCIDQNLVASERVFENLNDASDFLVGRICLVEFDKAQTVYVSFERDRISAEKTKECGELEEYVSDVLLILDKPIDIEESVNAKNRQLEIRRCRNEFDVPSTFNVFGSSELRDESIAYASRSLLNLRIARLDGDSTGDK